MIRRRSSRCWRPRSKPARRRRAPGRVRRGGGARSGALRVVSLLLPGGGARVRVRRRGRAARPSPAGRARRRVGRCSSAPTCRTRATRGSERPPSSHRRLGRAPGRRRPGAGRGARPHEPASGPRPARRSGGGRRAGRPGARVARTSGDREARVRALVLEASHLTDLGRDLGRARAALLEAEADAFPDGSPGLQQSVLRRFANLSYQLGRYDEAIEKHDRLLVLGEQFGNVQRRARAALQPPQRPPRPARGASGPGRARGGARAEPAGARERAAARRPRDRGAGARVPHRPLRPARRGARGRARPAVPRGGSPARAAPCRRWSASARGRATSHRARPRRRRPRWRRRPASPSGTATTCMPPTSGAPGCTRPGRPGPRRRRRASRCGASRPSSACAPRRRNPQARIDVFTNWTKDYYWLAATAAAAGPAGPAARVRGRRAPACARAAGGAGERPGCTADRRGGEGASALAGLEQVQARLGDGEVLLAFLVGLDRGPRGRIRRRQLGARDLARARAGAGHTRPSAAGGDGARLRRPDRAARRVGNAGGRGAAPEPRRGPAGAGGPPARRRARRDPATSFPSRRCARRRTRRRWARCTRSRSPRRPRSGRDGEGSRSGACPRRPWCWPTPPVPARARCATRAARAPPCGGPSAATAGS